MVSMPSVTSQWADFQKLFELTLFIEQAKEVEDWVFSFLWELLTGKVNVA